MKQLLQRLRRALKGEAGMTLKCEAGMTLIEMIITFALILVASGILLMGIQSIFGLTIESETRKQAQSELTEMVALHTDNAGEEEGGARTEEKGALTLPGGHSVEGAFATYEKGDVRFTVFEGMEYEQAEAGD